MPRRATSPRLRLMRHNIPYFRLSWSSNGTSCKPRCIAPRCQRQWNEHRPGTWRPPCAPARQLSPTAPASHESRSGCCMKCYQPDKVKRPRGNTQRARWSARCHSISLSTAVETLELIYASEVNALAKDERLRAPDCAPWVVTTCSRIPRNREDFC